MDSSTKPTPGAPEEAARGHVENALYRLSSIADKLDRPHADTVLAATRELRAALASGPRGGAVEEAAEQVNRAQASIAEQHRMHEEWRVAHARKLSAAEERVAQLNAALSEADQERFGKLLDHLAAVVESEKAALAEARRLRQVVIGVSSCLNCIGCRRDARAALAHGAGERSK